jgi:arylsulfatase A
MNGATRREFLQVLGGLAAGASLGEALAAPGGGGQRPNVVLMVADDLGRECLGSYGGTSWQTPHLDALAAGGTRFAHCYATPWCSPSRVELLTGKYGFRNYGAWGELDVTRDVTFAQLLRQAGYATAIAGKWQLCNFDDPANVDHPRGAGFEESCLWFGFARDPSGVYRYTSKYWDPWILQNGRRRTDLAGRYGPDVCRDFLVDFMRRHADRPFLAMHSMLLPHPPFDATPHSGVLDRALAGLPSGVRSSFSQRFFGEHLAYLDFCVGRIVAALEELGLRERTLVLFTSDNGTPRMIESRMGERVVPGGKGLMTDVGARVPLLAHWPGSVPAGRVCEDLVDLSDFLPTFVELGGGRLPPAEVFDGRSFLTQLRGEAGRPREWIYYQSDPEYGMDRAVRTREWKLLASGPLYHLSEDPWEERPIPAGAGPPDAERARERLQALLDSLGPGAPAAPPVPKAG